MVVVCDRVRLLAHLASVLLLSDDDEDERGGGVFSLLRTVLLRPRALRDTYLPTMPEDPAKMAQMVLGGRW